MEKSVHEYQMEAGFNVVARYYLGWPSSHLNLKGHVLKLFHSAYVEVGHFFSLVMVWSRLIHFIRPMPTAYLLFTIFTVTVCLLVFIRDCIECEINVPFLIVQLCKKCECSFLSAKEDIERWHNWNHQVRGHPFLHLLSFSTSKHVQGHDFSALVWAQAMICIFRHH